MFDLRESAQIKPYLKFCWERDKETHTYPNMRYTACFTVHKLSVGDRMGWMYSHLINTGIITGVVFVP